jgi:CTP synthase (UTP-ammonia lyase)
MTKYIFAGGGVVSSLGKGLTSASIGIGDSGIHLLPIAIDKKSSSMPA